MKSIIFLSIFIFYIESLNAQSAFPIQEINIDIELVGISDCCDNHIDSNQQLFYQLFGKIVLKNKSNSPISFWMMSCSWTDITVVEPKFITLDVKECDRNTFEKVVLNKNQEIRFNAIFDIPKQYFIDSINKTRNFNTFKVGFIIIYEDEFAPFKSKSSKHWNKLIQEKQNNLEYIWSNPVELIYCNYKWEIK